ncbi:ATP-binding protein [Nocardia sp. bgisy134]|uniref:ATP-binding protein n=1 Tax=Nocardia sp. bgisy134 TaxID=3413789 RepID=UPI003D75EEFD
MMTTIRAESYTEDNQRALVGQLARVYALLTDDMPALDQADVPGQLKRVVELFQLSPFERDLLLWCAGVELESRFAAAFGSAHGDPRRTHPTFGLALTKLNGEHWDALSPDRPLRYWRLIEMSTGPGLVDRPLQIDERILQFLTGVVCMDPRLSGLLEADDAAGSLASAHRHIVAEIVALLGQLVSPAAVVLSGASAAIRRRVAARIAVEAGRLPLVARSSLINASSRECLALARLIEREVALLGGLLYVDCGDAGEPESIDAFIGEFDCLILAGVAESGARPTTRATLICRSLPELTAADQLALWQDSLGPAAARYGNRLQEAADQFRFDATEVEAICAEQAAGGHDTSKLRQVCREHGRGRLDDLTQHISPEAAWTDLVLPDPTLAALHDIVRQARYRGLVYRDWGMADTTSRGLGVTALFVGDSGTGKTLAAEVLANELDLDLYRIDLALVVSKYIGETEKNLKRVFDAAETSGAVLLFDEADALFGKRSEAKDSHDRYANVEVAYLLQRMEAYRGLALLTTNMKTALDRAFLRRIRFIVMFPFPDLRLRRAIWERQLPRSLPTENLDFTRLAQLQVPGGNIRAIALSAAFLAAETGGPVRMDHLHQAARREYEKLEKPLTYVESRGWT